ncbi:hypothetical protein CI789_11190 [Erwinia persicina]|uniref:Uncharacterized protein n=1 Tax=Erwinia persicina TaxID=55211 RepID=A0A3S7S4X2_9GAMM|nr:hypothetical protein CI789_11190 [Erwinia persicina]TKJ93251.1 hypothetical protein EpCFBP13511_06160 [Erwinia persicina]HBH65255.1 hypothetical protein [Erwinia persicina]HBH68261.1 hypothetical protein [Erwinia persicina]HBI05994.1 hypothetical protein [Erwinia persicina]
MFSQMRSRLSKQNKQNQYNMPNQRLSLCFSMTNLRPTRATPGKMCFFCPPHPLLLQTIGKTFFINC